MAGLKAGSLRHRIRIEYRAAVENTAGDPIQDPNTGEIIYVWTLLASVWAAKMPLSAAELLRAQQIQSQVTTRFVIRYRDDIDAAMRIVHNGVTFNIEGLIPDPDSGLEWLTIPASSGSNDG